ncbi:hypothetical protein C8F01DRAFT_1024306 [Mycena amicta]|nr:hypothetical protein C8F01DRAFT_1024306 [Mycena amicta]
MWSAPLALLSAALYASHAVGLSLSTIPLGVRDDGTVCDGQINIAETFIGKDNNVQVQYATCPPPEYAALESRQTAPIDVCGNNCTTFCFTPSGGGPNPNDCTIIADALLFDSENIGPLFTIPTGANNTITMKYQSCLTFFVNQDVVPIEYCRTDWSALVKFIAPNCQAAQNAHGGLCVATNQQWFAQVQHS